MIRLAQQRWSIIAVVLALVGVNGLASTHYVVTNGTPGHLGPVDPYTSWETAGTNIIDVVKAAMTNAAPRVVWVTNGTYYPTNAIVVTNYMTIKSVNGRDRTILHGGATTNRCLSWTSCAANDLPYAATFDGFTVTNYSSTGNGTIYMALSNTRTGYIINCLITSNRVSTGGGIYQETFSGAGVFWATNCIVRGNYATYGGGIKFSTGGRYVSCVIENNVANYGGGIGNSSVNNTSMIISNCFIINNRSTVSSGGGGVYSLSPAKFANCVITGNVANGPGGGLLIENADLQDCIIIGNSSTNNNGGGVYGTNINLRNCLVAQNTAKTNAGGVYFYKRGTIMNCTVAGNYAGVLGGGLFITNASVYGTNSIIYHNTAGVSADNFTNTAGNTGLDYSCVFPAVNGVSNIISAPAFASVNGGNYRLTGQSPCFNTGTNQNWMTNAVDLDGRARILYNYVDMGCYEYRLPASGSTFTFH